MNKCYYRIVWENYPSINSPVNAQNLNKIDVATDEMDNRIISLDSTKFDKSEAQLLVKYIEYDENTGIFKITHYNGASYTIDTLLEKLAINFDYDYQTQRLIIELSDGTIKYVDLSALITQYEFKDSETIIFTVDNTGKVTAKVKEGSIEEKHLRPNYLADIKVEVAKAEASKNAAATSEANAKKSEDEAKKSQAAAKTSADNAATSATAAAGSASTAVQKATDAANSASAANTSAANAKTSEANAKTSETNAASSKTAAATSATNAATSATTAGTKATEASTYATQSKSYAIGGTGTRTGENTDNSKYYYEQSKGIYDNFNSAGNVTGVKGNAESSYRSGNVNLTPENIGAVAKSGDTMTGTLASSKVTGTYLKGNQGEAIINSTAKAGEYTMLDKLNSTNGYFTDGVYQDKRLLQYTAKSTVDAGTNSVTKSVKLLDEAGNSSFPGTVTAASFSGKWATARTIDGVSFDGSANITHYGTCSTAAATAAKVVACTGFTLATGATIKVKFTVTNTAANPTLNVNNTGAKPIYYRGAAITAGYLAQNRTYEFVYNGTQYDLVGDIDTKVGLTNNLTSTSTTTALTAAQGKALNDKITAINSSLNNSDNIRYDPESDYIQCLVNGEWYNAYYVGSKILYLFDNGDLCTNVTGGWSKDGYTVTNGGNAINSYTGPTLSNVMLVSNGSVNLRCGVSGTGKAIDLTNRKKLKIKASSTTASETRIFISSTKGVNYQSMIVFPYTNESTFEIDISGYKGNYYIGVVAGSTGNNSNYSITVKEISLE